MNRYTKDDSKIVAYQIALFSSALSGLVLENGPFEQLS